MQLFLDTANQKEIKKAMDWGAADGVTTNPSLISREKAPFHEQIKAICNLVDGPVFAEVISTDTDGIYREAMDLANISSQVVVKIPMLTEGITAVKRLKLQGVKTLVTLVFSIPQAFLAAKAGADYIAPFLGRVDDAGQDGLGLVADVKSILAQYGYNTQIVAASIRHTNHVLGCLQAEVDCVTMPLKVLEGLYNHPQTREGIDRFLSDWKQLEA